MTRSDMKPGVSSLKAKRGVSDEQRQQVIELRRRHSFREVAKTTGLPIGTVKAIVSRSGAFRDNDKHRALFTLPPTKVSAETLPSAPELPSQQAVTGDKEVDAVLWLHTVIRTGQVALIELAMEAAKKLKTPLDVLEKRYRAYLTQTSPGNLFAALSSFGFGDLEGMATNAIEAYRLRVEGVARFGGHLMADTDAETFCIDAIRGLERNGPMLGYEKCAVATRFNAAPDLLPHTLSECLNELDYWDHLYRLRNAVDTYASDGPAEASARDWFVFGLLAEIRPRDKAEALAVFRYLMTSDRYDMAEAEAILCNLIG